MKKLPLVSRSHVIKNRKQILRNPLPFHHDNFNRLGDVFEVAVGFGKRIVFTRDAQFIKQVLQTGQKKYQKSSLQTKDLAKYIGKGLLTSNGEHWRKHRRLVQPAFHKKKLQGLLQIMYRAIATEVDRIRPNEHQDVYPLMGDLAFQVVATSLFSRDDIQKEMAALKDITESNQRMLIKEMRQPYLNWWYRLSGKIAHHKKLSNGARDILNTIVDERLAQESDKDDLLDMLLNARYEDGTPMPRRQLLDEVLILFAAGHETTANALGFTLFLLARHQEVQERAHSEVARIPWDTEITMGHLRQLGYVKQCVEEGMRLYPPAYYIDRECVAEDTANGYTIPKGTMLLLAIYELHRDPRFWETPEDFVPERFDPSNKKDFSDYYFPFGAGPRMCVGNNFAMQEMILTVAEILRKFRLQPPAQPLEVDPLISLKPKGIPLFFESR
ncbi:cytochrome P450 [Maribacter sp. 2307ULW6-5]|uniref:cytochrome P450 n=1 Tax=Maribacter sp. 2307ULW6-5 TaxID=3386275 RepID=UPI0039BC2C5A